jgi:hypothetical protein
MRLDFRNVTATKITVLLDGKKVGFINKVEGGWQYAPVGSKVKGEVFHDIADCKRSLYLE